MPTDSESPIQSGVAGLAEITRRVKAGTIPLPTDEELRLATPELWRQYDERFPDPMRPVLSRLALALYRRLSYQWAAKYWTPKPMTWPSCLPPRRAEDEEADMELQRWSNATRFARLQSEISEILDCISGPATPAQRRRGRDSFTECLHSAGMQMQDVVYVAELVNKPRSGRPITRRLAAVRALELKLLRPTLNWREIHSLVYYSRGTASHKTTPPEHLSAEVRVVKRLLRKYDVPVD